jgi:hypothetical protein
VQTAIDIDDAGLRKCHLSRFAFVVAAEIEWPGLGEREDVVKDWIHIWEGDLGANRNYKQIGRESAIELLDLELGRADWIDIRGAWPFKVDHDL